MLRKKLPAILKTFICSTDVPLIPFYSAKFLKKIVRADIVTAFYYFWDKLDKIFRKSLEQIYSKLKISKIHCYHPLPRSFTHTHTLHQHHHLKQFTELTIISYEACLSKAVTIALYCWLQKWLCFRTNY